jgi:hypothetical protein
VRAESTTLHPYSTVLVGALGNVIGLNDRGKDGKPVARVERRIKVVFVNSCQLYFVSGLLDDEKETDVSRLDLAAVNQISK